MIFSKYCKDLNLKEMLIIPLKLFLKNLKMNITRKVATLLEKSRKKLFSGG